MRLQQVRTAAGESWLGVTWLGVQDFVLGIKRMDQHVSPPSAPLFFFSTTSSNLQMLEESLVVEGTESSPEVSAFRGDSGAEAVPALWSWERLGGLHGPRSVVGSLWGPWRMGSLGVFSALQRREQGENCGNNHGNFMSMNNLCVVLIKY